MAFTASNLNIPMILRTASFFDPIMTDGPNASMWILLCSDEPHQLSPVESDELNSFSAWLGENSQFAAILQPLHEYNRGLGVAFLDTSEHIAKPLPPNFY